MANPRERAEKLLVACREAERKNRRAYAEHMMDGGSGRHFGEQAANIWGWMAGQLIGVIREMPPTPPTNTGGGDGR